MLLATSLGPVELLRRMLEIERGMGRDREHVPAKGPRVIDLDLLLYEDRILELPELTLPHPAMHERRFVLEPLNEIAPNWWHPRVGLTVAEMLARLPKT
jgi:2-amino-4-hydroxy-6-hydroxymethyldihydropteridine diphosphokinase